MGPLRSESLHTIHYTFPSALVQYHVSALTVTVCVCVCLSHPAEDGHQVMFTHGEHVNVFDDHHLVVVFVENGIVQHVCGGDGGEVKTLDFLHL